MIKMPTDIPKYNCKYSLQYYVAETLAKNKRILQTKLTVYLMRINFLNILRDIIRSTTERFRLKSLIINNLKYWII